MELYNADCFEILPKIKEDSVNFVLVDLPYDQTDFQWDTGIDLKKMWTELKRCCTKNCIYAFFCTTSFGYKLINSNPAWFSYDLVWEKQNTLGFLGAKKHPLRKHEMIYIFKDYGSNDRLKKNNKELREYSKSIMDYLDGIKGKEIIKQMGNESMSHFLYYKAEQYAPPTKKSYKKFTEIFKVDQMEGFKTFEEIREIWDREREKIKQDEGTFIYNPQMTEGKPYKTHSERTLKDTTYGTIECTKKDNKGTRYPTSILKFGYDKEKYHPTQKPVKLCEWLIKTYTNEGDVVLDFTAGSGSTGVACKNTGRIFIGVEKDKKYFDIAHKRLND